MHHYINCLERGLAYLANVCCTGLCQGVDRGTPTSSVSSVQRENRRVKTRPRTVTRVPRAPHISLISALGESVPAARVVGFQVAFGEFLPCWVTSCSSLVRAASAFSPAIVFASSTAA